MIMEIKDIPLFGNYSYGNETSNKYEENYNIDSNQLYYKIMTDCIAEVDNHAKNIYIGTDNLRKVDINYWETQLLQNMQWSIQPYDSLGNDLLKGDKVAYVTTYYDDRFEQICKGTIIGFTNNFIKIKPDEQYIQQYQEKEYILRKYNRVIRL